MSHREHEFEIAFSVINSIADGPSLEAILMPTLRVLVRMLNLEAAAIFGRSGVAESALPPMLASVPAGIASNPSYLIGLAHVSRLLRDPGALRGDHYCEEINPALRIYILELPAFGLILLINAGAPIPASMLRNLEAVAKKWAHSANSFLARQGTENQKLDATIALTKTAIEREAKRVLIASEEKYRALVETTGTGYLIVDRDGQVIDANSEYIRLTGHAALDDILGKSILEWTALHDIEKNAAAIAQCARDGVIRNFVVDYVDRSGRITPIEVNATVIGDKDSLRIIALCRDISERREIEGALVRSEQRFRSFVENANDVLFALTQEGVFSYVSPQWQVAFGYGLDETVGKPFAPFVHPEDVAGCFTFLQAVMTTAEKRSGIEYRVLCKDGTYRWYRANASLIQDPTDGTPTLIGIGRDITDDKETEKGLILARQIFDTASEAIFVSDLQGNLLDVNAEACRLAKYSREEMLRLKYVDVVAPEELPRGAPELALADAYAIDNRWLLRCSDGATVPLDLVVQRLPGDRNLAIGRDLTEREKTLKQLAAARDAAQAANFAKSRFLAAASHDLRQPIQAINLFQDALRKTGLNDEQMRISDYLSLSAQNLGDLLNALLDVSKLDAGSVTPHPEAIGIKALLAAIDAEFSPLALARSLRFRLHFPFDDIAVLADPKLLQSLLANLIGNAIKYTNGGGILVGIRRRGRCVLIQVWDTGVGIAPEHLHCIFEEYFQIGNPERDRSKGLGLGLAIVKRLAHVLETGINCRSRLGRGSVFEFQLPLADLPTETHQVRNSRPFILIDPPHWRPVALVEDDPIVTQALVLSLEALGMRVTSFRSAEEALASREINDAYFYISDFRLPGLNGLQFLDVLQQRLDRPIKAVVLTGDTAARPHAGASSSRWPVLFKPIEISELIAAIEAQDALEVADRMS